MADNFLAKAIREAMRNSGLTRYQLSQQTGIAQAVLGRFLAGKRDITLCTAARLFPAIDLALVRVSKFVDKVDQTTDELAALRDDRDRWTTAVQAEGRVKTLGQGLAEVTADRDWLGNRIHETEPKPDPQPDAAEEHRQAELDQLSAELVAARDVCDGLNERLAELRVDRDKWQTRAVQAEGRVKTLGQELAAMTSDRDGFQQRLVEAEARIGTLTEELAVATADKNTFRADANRARDQLEIARQQLQDRDAADQVPGNEALRQQVTQLIAERERFTQQLRQYEQQNVKLTKDLEGLRFEIRHSEQQRMILAETSQDQLGQIRMAERIVSLLADKVAQLAVERGVT